VARHRRATDLVIGSGPTGWAAALAVAEAGRTPLVVDFGAAPALAAASYDKASTLALKGDISRLRVFDYPRGLVASRDAKQLPLSSARGGLSSIWGAGILLRAAVEMPELGPVAADVVASYERLLRHMPAAGAGDALSRRFPWPEGTPTAPQSARFASMLRSVPDDTGDVLFGHPRVSLHASACIRSGQCLVGCPLDLFFSAGTAFAAMQADGRCELLTGPVTHLEPRGAQVVVHLPGEAIEAERVFVAAGPVASPALLQRSGLAPATLVVKDSAVFYAALWNRRPANGDEADYTAAQAVAYSAAAGSTDFQLSIYESNPDYVERLAALSPVLGRLATSGSRLIGRVNAGIGFLDSSVSGQLEVATRGGRTFVTRREAPGSRRRARDVMKRVGRATRALGLVPVPGAVLVPAAGSGYHSGAGLPIGSDLVDHAGCLRAAPRVRVVDASALPKVWAGSHTFTAMANAYRTAAGA
jgi:choline dehydrogenase-like flavoprotein